MGDFELDPELKKFDETVTPEIGNMTSEAEKVVEKFDKVAQTATECGEGMSGNYVTNNTGKVVEAYQKLGDGCKKDKEDMQSKMLGAILPGCTDLAAKIAELKQIIAKAQAVMAEIASLKAIISSKESADPPQDASAERAQLAKKEQELEALKAEFKAKQAEAKAKLGELKGMDATITIMEPTNGTLSFEPMINVSAEKGINGGGEYYNYAVGDQSITSIENQ